tara:strand:- start:573 stop:1211 length:639 start_codon:yes stop_codon:yes gene_type:complete
MLATPANGCDYCYPSPPTVRLQYAGDSIDRTKPLIDTSSELLNIVNPASKCPQKKWVSQKVNNLYKFNPDSRKELGQKVPVKEGFVSPVGKKVGCVSKNENLTHWKSCFDHSIESRYTHPASTLRGTGFDRWEWLCFNPQEKAAIPFDCYIPNRILVKDNHRPCIPRPIDYRPVLPPNQEMTDCEKTTPVCAVPTHPSSLPCKMNSFYSQNS